LCARHLPSDKRLRRSCYVQYETSMVSVRKARKDSKNTEGGDKNDEYGKLRLKTVLRRTRANTDCVKIRERREKGLKNVG
jgi:hypothetical protein